MSAIHSTFKLHKLVPTLHTQTAIQRCGSVQYKGGPINSPVWSVLFVMVYMNIDVLDLMSITRYAIHVN